MKAEIAGEQMQDAMDMGADVEGEADDVYEQILGEIGMDMQGAAVGMGGIASAPEMPWSNPASSFPAFAPVTGEYSGTHAR